jgi:exopolysaccharide production protein ExoZ
MAMTRRLDQLDQTDASRHAAPFPGMATAPDVLSTVHGRGELHGLQMLRGVAASMVVAHHILGKSDTVAGRFSPLWLNLSLSSGVDIFFVISGFIMLYTTFGRTATSPSPLEFIIKRVVRIYPFYWFCCLILITLVSVHIFKPRLFDLSEVIESMLLVPGHNSLLATSWTLSYEMFFYFIFGATLFFRSQVTTLVGTSVAIGVAYIVGVCLLNGPAYDFLGG